VVGAPKVRLAWCLRAYANACNALNRLRISPKKVSQNIGSPLEFRLLLVPVLYQDRLTAPECFPASYRPGALVG